MTTTFYATQYVGEITYLDHKGIAKLHLRDNNLQHLLNIIANMDDLEITEIHAYREE